MKLSQNLYWLLVFWMLCSVFPPACLAQTTPTILLSKNTISSILQDQLSKSIMAVDAPQIRNFIFYAPSYCLTNDSTITFRQIVAKENVDFNKIDVLGNCEELNSLKLSLLALNQKSFIIISGRVVAIHNKIKTILTSGIGSTRSLNDLAVSLTRNKVVNQISINELAVLYDHAKLEKINTSAKFTPDGLVIGQNYAELSLIGRDSLDRIILELQSTGITSIGTFLPLDFVNKQFENLVIPYTDDKGTDIELRECKFISDSTGLFFQTIISGKTISNFPMHNQYQITVTFNPIDLSWVDATSKMVSGVDNKEPGAIRSVVNTFSDGLRGKSIFKLPNEKYYTIKSDDGEQKINIRTYYGRFVNGIFVFVNSFNIR